MDKAKIPLAAAYRLLNPGSVVWVSVGDGERDNLLAVTWNIPAKKDPPLVALVSGKRHFSYPFIERTRELAINIPHARDAAALHGCGTVSGRDVPDKFERFGLHREKADGIRAPLVAEAVANLECRVTELVDISTSTLILAEVISARAATDHFRDGHWTFDNGLELLHHLSGNRFCVSSRELTVDRAPTP